MLNLRLANRHGLIAGATGTGKTVSLQVLAEELSRNGVPVFLADVKGDLSGLGAVGTAKKGLLERAETIGLENYENEDFPVVFWDLYGKKGHKIRTTVSEMGPLLLSRLLNLNETQEGILYIVFEISDDEGLLLLDLKDLRALLNYVGENRKELALNYGNISTQSIGAIQRKLLVLEKEGGRNLFGEPAFELKDFMQLSDNGYGHINILAADKLLQNPRLYSTFLLWLLSELFEELPEIGDPEKPELVFFFDEAHVLFDGAPSILIEKIEQVVKLIRSKGVGVYFVTQNPLDVPDSILAQLGNRIQHALRAYTPREQKAVRVAADTFRQNKSFKTREAITQLGVGEALISTLSGKGIPGIVQRVLVRPPASRMGPLKRGERQLLIEESPFYDKYEETIDRESAYESLLGRAEVVAQQQEVKGEKSAKVSKRVSASAASKPRMKKVSRSNRQSYFEAFTKSFLRSMAGSMGRKLMRGIMGSYFKGR